VNERPDPEAGVGSGPIDGEGDSSTLPEGALVIRAAGPGSSAIARFAIGALAAGLSVLLVFSTEIVAADLPTLGDASNGAVPLAAVNTTMRSAVGWLALALLLAVPLLTFAVGWRLRGTGVLGAWAGTALGAWVGFSSGDQLALIVNPSSFPLNEAADGMVGVGLVALGLVLLVAVPLIGLIGWGIGRWVRSRRGPARRRAPANLRRAHQLAHQPVMEPALTTHTGTPRRELEARSVARRQGATMTHRPSQLAEPSVSRSGPKTSAICARVRRVSGRRSK
jgi:hypothetical protein